MTSQTRAARTGALSAWLRSIAPRNGPDVKASSRDQSPPASATVDPRVIQTKRPTKVDCGQWTPADLWHSTRQYPTNSLLGLPAEIRAMIYEYIIDSHEGFNQPALFRTCRATRMEGLDMFYSTARLRLSAQKLYNHKGRILRVLTALGPRRTRMIRQIEFVVQALERTKNYSAWDLPVRLAFTIEDTTTDHCVWAGEYDSDLVVAAHVAHVQEALCRLNSLSIPMDSPNKILLLYEMCVPCKVMILKSSMIWPEEALWERIQRKHWEAQHNMSDFFVFAGPGN